MTKKLNPRRQILWGCGRRPLHEPFSWGAQEWN